MGSEGCALISSHDRGGDPKSKEMENRDGNLAGAEGSRGQLSDGKDAWKQGCLLWAWFSGLEQPTGWVELEGRTSRRCIRP